MRLIMFILLAAPMLAPRAWADPDRARAFYVRYAISMDFLPPLTGERKCIRARPCELVKLDHFSLTLTAPIGDADARSGRLTTDCSTRKCALKDGERSIDFHKKQRFVRFEVDNREYSLGGRAVLRSRGDRIGEILLAY